MTRLPQHDGDSLTIQPRKWPLNIDPTPGKRIGVVSSWNGNHGIILAIFSEQSAGKTLYKNVPVSVDVDDICSVSVQPFLVVGEEVELSVLQHTISNMRIAVRVSRPQNSCIQCDELMCEIKLR